MIEKRNVVVRGEWGLWIYRAQWELRDSAGAVVVDSDDEDALIDRGLAEALDGQILQKVDLDPHQRTTVFTFDLGATLIAERVPPPPDLGEGDIWILWRPDETTVTYRGDGYYQIAPIDDYKGGWKPLE